MIGLQGGTALATPPFLMLAQEVIAGLNVFFVVAKPWKYNFRPNVAI